MKKVFSILLSLISLVASAQTYNPTQATVSNKPYGPAQGVPTDSRSMFFDGVNFLWRWYQSPTEVLTYLNLPKYRAGNFIIIVDSGGTLNGNGTYTGGIATFYEFKDGVADGNLVKLNLLGGGGGGSGTVTNVTASNGSGITWTITNPTTTPNLSVVTAAGGDASGPLNLLSVNKFNSQLPSYYLNYNNLTNTPTIPAQFNPIAGANMSITGVYPNITFATSGIGFTTAGVDLKAISSSTVGIDTQNYRKQDTSYMISDSVMIITINSRPDTLSIRGGAHGSGGGTGSVTSVSVVTANGVSGTVANPTSTPAITLTLGAITPISVNGDTLAQISNGFTIKGGTGTSRTLTVNAGNANVSGTNTGDVTLTGENYISISGQVINANAVNVSGTNITGILKAASFPALTGDVTTSAGALATTISNNVVTNAKLAQMGSLTIKGNNTGGTANAADLTVAQVNAILPVFTSSLNGLVPASGGGTTNFLRADGSWAVAGTGNPNSNVGAGYRLAIPGTNNIKTLFAGYGVIEDSTSNTNGITFIVDTTTIAVKGTDSIFVHNVGSSGLGLLYSGADTLYGKKIVAGANVTLTQNSDSSITINAGGGGSGVIFIGAVNSQAPNANGGVISSDSLYFQYATATVPGLMSTVAQTIAGAKTYSAAPTFTTLTTNGGIFYGNGSGTLLQTNAGTSVQVLHGGSSPTYGLVVMTTDISGITPIANGGNGTATPTITAGAGVTITGTWNNYTITNSTLGTVTSVGVSGGTTGLTTSGGPVTTSGTITLGGTLVVSNGGLGVNSLTPYALIAGGSTSSGPTQQVSGVGTTGQILTSNGAGNLPSWQTVSAGITLTTSGTSGAATLISGVLNIPIYGSLTRQNITSGSSGTVTGGNYLVNFNPASVLAAYALTLAASPSDQQVVEIEAGGTIAGGAAVVTAFSIVANGGQTIIQSSVPSTLSGGEHLKYRYNSSLSIWYREN